MLDKSKGINPKKWKVTYVAVLTVAMLLKKRSL